MWPLPIRLLLSTLHKYTIKHKKNKVVASHPLQSTNFIFGGNLYQPICRVRLSGLCSGFYVIYFYIFFRRRDFHFLPKQLFHHQGPSERRTTRPFASSLMEFSIIVVRFFVGHKYSKYQIHIWIFLFHILHLFVYLIVLFFVLCFAVRKLGIENP